MPRGESVVVRPGGGMADDLRGSDRLPVPPEMRARLKAALEKSGKTMRQASLEAGFGPNFLSELIRLGKAPSYWRLEKICRVIGTTVPAIVFGQEVTPVRERMARVLDEYSEEEHEALLELLTRLRPAP